jgi:hypothetical protein
VNSRSGRLFCVHIMYTNSKINGVCLPFFIISQFEVSAYKRTMQNNSGGVLYITTFLWYLFSLMMSLCT